MNRLIIILIGVFATTSVFAQGPPIFTETPILLGLDGGGIRTFGRFIVKENATVYVQPLAIPYNLGSKTQIGIAGRFININADNFESVSGFGDLTLFLKQQVYQKDGKAKTFRIIAKLDQVFPTGKTNSTPSIGSDSWQSQLSLVTGYVTLKYGIYGQVGYNITSNGLPDNLIYNAAFVYPLLPQKYPPNQLNLNIGINGNFFTDVNGNTVLASGGIQWITSKTALFEAGLQIPIVEEVPEAQKTNYVLTFGTRILIF
ncbi:transporter [Leeuwenhoekiella aequorea]|uniref:transporter n=1 Tax=Leeuwenhoekiella aequorea TaxID=283736 RepID=UPI00352C9CFF|tara:strand:+ start:21271 stop:22044 length:774 start_codon:yes stop_codon:yes gene_type:complete